MTSIPIKAFVRMTAADETLHERCLKISPEVAMLGPISMTNLVFKRTDVVLSSYQKVCRVMYVVVM
jgi:hypothetical protein